MDNYVEYILDIAFNNMCDKMAISTTSHQIIIYQKVNQKSNELIYIEKELKEVKDNHQVQKDYNDNQIKTDNSKSPEIKKIKMSKFSNTEKKTKMKKEISNMNILSKHNKNKKRDFNLMDSMDINTKTTSSKSLISIDSDDKNKKYQEKNEDYIVKPRNNSLFKSIDFSDKNNFKYRYNINKIIDPNEESFESLYNSPSHLRYSKNKEYEYRWEKIYSLFIDGPALRLQWAKSEFGNILACSGYNRCVYIIKEQKWRNKTDWRCSSQIKEFTDSVVDLSFAPYGNSLLLATLSSDGSLKLLNLLNNETKWQLLQSLNISKNGCTCLCCNPSNLDRVTIAIGCKRIKIKDEINNVKNKSDNDSKNLKRQESIKNLYGLIKIVYFLNINEPLIGTIEGHEDDITDVDWANRNGRTHHMICSTSKDGKFIIWEIILNEENNDDNNKINSTNFFSYQILMEYKHSKPLWRCSFNESGIMVSCVDEDGEVLVFYKIKKNEFIKLDIHKMK